MHLLFGNLLPDAGQKDLHLLRRHAQAACHDRHARPLQRAQEILACPEPQRLEFRVFRPRADRPGELRLDDVDVACLFHVGLVFRGAVPVFAERAGTGRDLCVPLFKPAAGQCAVRRLHGQEAILQLEVASWARVCVGALDDVEVGTETGRDGAEVDVVELVRVQPGVFGVVDFEAAVWGDEGGLDGGEVRADYGRGGVLVCEFDGPDSGAGSDVEDVVDAAREVFEWGEVETSVEG